jgi:hypothetical protein
MCRKKLGVGIVGNPDGERGVQIASDGDSCCPLIVLA